LINNQALCVDPTIKERIHSWVRETLRQNWNHHHDYEVSWCLLVAGILRLNIEQQDINPLLPTPSPLVLTLLALLHQNGLLSVRLSKFGWRSKFNEESIYGEYWLFYYEAVLRNWTTDKQIVSAVKGDAIFNSMLNSRVTFLEDEMFDATHIDVKKRKYKSKHSKKSHTTKPHPRIIVAQNYDSDPADFFDNIEEDDENDVY
jgi:hypothetical protein